MKKIAKQIVLLFILINLGLTLQMSFANAEGETPIPKKDETTTENPLSKYYGPLGQIEKIGGKTGLPDFLTGGQHPDAATDYAQPGAGTITSPIYFAIDLFRYFISGIALIIIVIQAIKLISTDSDEEAGKAKSTLLLCAAGLIVIQLADTIVKKMFFGEQGEAFEDITTAEIYAEETVNQVRGIIGFVEFFLGSVAILVIIIRGVTLIAGGGEEEATKKAKNQIIYALVGLAIIALSEVVVRGVIFPEAGSKLPDVDRGKFILVTLTNYLAGFIAIIAFAGLFYGGYLYVTSGGKEDVNDKIKKIVLGAVIALVLALGAYAAVNTLIKFTPYETEEKITQPEIIEIENKS